MVATRKDIEKAATLHRNRVTLTLRNVRSLEKVCADLISGAKKQKLSVKGPVRMPTKILRITTRLAVMVPKRSLPDAPAQAYHRSALAVRDRQADNLDQHQARCRGQGHHRRPLSWIVPPQSGM
uniref:40S ribosomal protein S20 n=1 Tax=Culex pipiens TaxID=7175 RepID=A0A8D8NS91_CULPI